MFAAVETVLLVYDAENPDSTTPPSETKLTNIDPEINR
jgi:hypothetical protein